MMPRLILAFASLMGCCLLVTGCSSEKGVPKVTIVTGEVKYQGKAVEGADVTFSPAIEGAAFRPASGKTDAQGKFSLKTYLDAQHELQGAIPGDYQVTVVKKEGTAVSSEDAMKMMQSGRPLPPPKDLLPAKYGLPKTSALVRTVRQGEKNDFPIDLTD